MATEKCQSCGGEGTVKAGTLHVPCVLCKEERQNVALHTIYQWDCPGCGEVIERESNDPGDDECEHCQTKVYID